LAALAAAVAVAVARVAREGALREAELGDMRMQIVLHWRADARPGGGGAVAGPLGCWCLTLDQRRR
jgi:hypothetical protein